MLPSALVGKPAFVPLHMPLHLLYQLVINERLNLFKDFQQCLRRIDKHIGVRGS